MIDPAKTVVGTQWPSPTPLISCRFDPLGRYAFAGGQDNKVYRWDVATGTQTALTGHESWVRAIAFHPNGETTYTADYAGRMLWWPTAAEAPQPTRTIEAHRGWVRAIAVSPDGATIATAGNDHLVRLWSTADGAPLGELAGHACHVYNLAFLPAGGQLASADLKGIVKHWDLSTMAEVRQLDASPLHKFDAGFQADIGGARSMAFSADGKYLACGGITNVSNAFAGVGNPVAVLFDWAEGKAVQQHVSSGGVQGNVWGLAFHPDGYLVGAVGGTGGGHLFFWKPDAPGEAFHFPLPNTARDMHLHADNLRLAVAHADNHLRVVQLAI